MRHDRKGDNLRGFVTGVHRNEMPHELIENGAQVVHMVGEAQPNIRWYWWHLGERHRADGVTGVEVERVIGTREERVDGGFEFY